MEPCPAVRTGTAATAGGAQRYLWRRPSRPAAAGRGRRGAGGSRRTFSGSGGARSGAVCALPALGSSTRRRRQPRRAGRPATPPARGSAPPLAEPSSSPRPPLADWLPAKEAGPEGGRHVGGGGRRGAPFAAPQGLGRHLGAVLGLARGHLRALSSPWFRGGCSLRGAKPLAWPNWPQSSATASFATAERCLMRSLMSSHDVRQSCILPQALVMPEEGKRKKKRQKPSAKIS